MIYLDNAATTKISKTAFEAACWTIHDCYGNPSSLHKAGTEAAQMVAKARKQIARCIGAMDDEIVFTAGGSESDNLALRGIAPYLKENGKTTIITSQIEHHAVLNTCKVLEKDGFKVIYMPVDEDGRVDIEELERVMKIFKDTIGLVSIMAVNNEIGSIQLIDDIGDLCQEYGVLFMTDAVQALGHIHLDVNTSHIDLMAMSGHKIHAMKGIGALYVRRGIKLEPVITGGGQENHLRAGTENVPGIVSMGEAAEKIIKNIDADRAYYEHLRKLFLGELDRLGVNYVVNCSGGVPNIISLTLPKCESEAMLLLLNEKGICVSAGSACTAGSLDPSHVLKALYLDDQDASCTIRISMGANNCSDDMIKTANAIFESVQQLQSMM
jgi:cysteine desulfurase